MTNLFANVAKWTSSKSALTILIVLLFAAGAGAGMSQANEGRITELFIPDDLPALDTQHKIEDIWGRSEGTFFLYLSADATHPDLLRTVKADTLQLQALDFVQQTSSIIDFLETNGSIDDMSDSQLRAVAQQIAASPAGPTVWASDALLVRIEIDAGLNAVTVTDALNEIRDASAGSDVRSAGLLYIEREQTAQAGGDVGILMPLSMVVVILVLSFLFRRVQDVVVPIVTTLVAIAMAYGTVAWAGLALAPPSFIVMPLLLGLGIDYMLHIVYVYREQPTSDAIPDRFYTVGKKVGLPVFYTALTTLIGFGSFLVSTIPQIRTWGLLIGSGALYSFVLGFTLLPALYRIRRRREPKASRQPLAGILDRVADALPRHRKKTLAIGATVTLLLGASILLLEVTPTLEFEPDNSSQAVIDLDAVQERFGGQTIAQFLLPATDRSALQAFEAELDQLATVGFVDGPQHRQIRAGDPSGQYPASDVATSDWWRVIVGYDYKQADAAIADLESTRDALVPEAKLTGQDIMDREGQDQFLPNIGLSTGIALGLVALLLGAIFRRPLVALLAFMPIIITMIWQLGIQGLAGIPLNPITGVMTAMMIGVGVDYSIHMMVHFREQRRLGDTREVAAQHAIRSVGKPVMAATITTVFAFSVLSLSSLLPLRDFGRVAAIVVSCAFIVSLTILPAVLALGSRTAQARREDEEFDAGNVEAGAMAPRNVEARYTASRNVEAPAVESPMDTRLPEVEPGPFVDKIHPKFNDPAVQKWFDES